MMPSTKKGEDAGLYKEVFIESGIRSFEFGNGTAPEKKRPRDNGPHNVFVVSFQPTIVAFRTMLEDGVVGTVFFFSCRMLATLTVHIVGVSSTVTRSDDAVCLQPFQTLSPFYLSIVLLLLLSRAGC